MADAKIRLSVDGAAVAKSEIDKVYAALGNMGGGADFAKNALKGLAGTITAGAFIAMIRGSIDAADGLNDLSKSTGLAIETLSGLKLASKQSGADLDGTAASINKLSVNIGKNAEKFAALGVTAKDPLEAFKQLSDVFKNIDDPQLRAAVGAEALGKSWASAAPLLMAGSQEIQEMVDKGAKLSGVNTEMAEQADAFNDKLAELTGTGGMMNGMTAKLLPLLNLVADELLDMHKNTDGANDGFSILAETFRAVVVLGGNVAFVFKGVGREIGGVAAQLAAFGTGDFKGALAIGDMMKSDAAQARKDFDAWEAKANIVGTKLAKSAYAGYTTGQNEPRAKSDNAAARDFVKTPKEAGEKVSEYQRLQQEITKVIAVQDLELLQGGKLAASSKYQTEELQKITFAFSTHKISQQERLKLIDLTTTAAAKMYAVEKQAYEQDAIKKNTESLEKHHTALNGTVESLIASNEAQRLENETIGLTARQINALVLSRQDSAIATKQQELATLASNGADATTIALMEREINLLTQKRGLTAEQQTKTELSLELKGYDATAAQLESLANITGKMGDGFKKATAALGGFATAFKTLSNAEKNEKLTTDERTAAQVGGYAEMAGAAKSFFEENSAGYEIMKAAEQGFRAFELAMSIQSMVQKTVEATTKVTANGTIAASGVMAGAGEMFAALGPFGFPAVAAMLAVMASLGFGGGGSSSSFGTAGAGNQIGADGRKATSTSPADNEPTNYDPATGAYTKQNKPQKTEQEMIDFANAAAIDAAANAVANLRIEAMKLTKGSEDLEMSLARASLAAGGMGKAQHELATQGMNEAELASYNYNQALMGQISVQMDIANGTSLTSDNMKKLAGESRSLAIELMMASGDIAGARAMQRDDDTAGYTAQEVAMYDNNQAMRNQIDAMNAGASAAREVQQAEEELANQRYTIAGRLNVLLGRQTQQQFDRATELAAATDASVIAMLNEIYKIEDLTAARDASFATLESSIAKEKEVANLRFKSATDLATALKTTRDAISPTLDRASAQSQIAMYVALAKAGGVLPTASALKPALDSIAKPSMDLFKTFSEYAIDQARTANDIADLSGYADKQVSIEQQTIDRLDSQLDTAKQALDVMKGVDNSVMGVGDAVKAFEASMLALASAKSSAASYSFAAPSAYSGGGGGGGYSGGGASSAASTAGMDSDIVAAYKEYYGRAPDQAGHDAFMKSGLLGDKLMQAILGASVADPNGADFNYATSHGYNPYDPMANYLKSTKKGAAASTMVDDFGSFANGGDHTGGLRLVGERGPELEVTGPSRITNTESLMSMLKNGGNNDALVAEIRALRAEVQELRKTNDKGNENTKRTADTLQGQQGVPFLVEIAQ